MIRYRGYRIEPGARGFRVVEPGGTWWAEVAATVGTAKRWIDCHHAERVARNARRAQRFANEGGR